MKGSGVTTTTAVIKRTTTQTNVYGVNVFICVSLLYPATTTNTFLEIKKNKSIYAYMSP